MLRLAKHRRGLMLRITVPSNFPSQNKQLALKTQDYLPAKLLLNTYASQLEFWVWQIRQDTLHFWLKAYFCIHPSWVRTSCHVPVFTCLIFPSLDAWVLRSPRDVPSSPLVPPCTPWQQLSCWVYLGISTRCPHHKLAPWAPCSSMDGLVGSDSDATLHCLCARCLWSGALLVEKSTTQKRTEELI